MHETGIATARYLKAKSYKGRGNRGRAEELGKTSRLSWVVANFGNFNSKAASCNLALRPNQHVAASAVSNPTGFACDARLDVPPPRRNGKFTAKLSTQVCEEGALRQVVSGRCSCMAAPACELRWSTPLPVPSGRRFDGAPAEDTEESSILALQSPAPRSEGWVALGFDVNITSPLGIGARGFDPREGTDTGEIT